MSSCCGPCRSWDCGYERTFWTPPATRPQRPPTALPGECWAPVGRFRPIVDLSGRDRRRLPPSHFSESVRSFAQHSNLGDATALGLVHRLLGSSQPAATSLPAGRVPEPRPERAKSQCPVPGRRRLPNQQEGRARPPLREPASGVQKSGQRAHDRGAADPAEPKREARELAWPSSKPLAPNVRCLPIADHPVIRPQAHRYPPSTGKATSHRSSALGPRSRTTFPSCPRRCASVRGPGPRFQNRM